MGTFGGAQPIVTDGLVFAVDAANYQSYPGSGTTWSDMAGNNNGTLTYGPTFDSGNGGSIVFDGSDDYVDANFNTSGVNQMTLDVWVYLDDDPSDGTVIGKWIAQGTRSFLIWWDIGVTPNFRFITQNTSFQNTITSESDSNANNNAWNHVVATFDSNSGIKLYVNNDLKETVNHASTPFVMTSTTNFGIGDDTSGSRYLKGKISQAKIYNRVLTSDEITQNYNALKSRFGL